MFASKRPPRRSKTPPRGKEEEGKGLEGKGVEKCAGGPMSPGGVVVHQTLRGTPALGCPPLGFLGKGRDRGQGRLVEGERGRERERDRPQ